MSSSTRGNTQTKHNEFQTGEGERERELKEEQSVSGSDGCQVKMKRRVKEGKV